jgi:hypothetical protein
MLSRRRSGAKKSAAIRGNRSPRKAEVFFAVLFAWLLLG